MPFDVGDTAPLRLDVDPHDGSTQAVAVTTTPTGATVTLNAVTDDGGATWTAPLLLTEAGAWHIQWTVTGEGGGVEADRVYAFAPVTGRTYASLSDLASYLRAEPSATADRDLISATRLVDALLVGSVYQVTDVDNMPVLTVHVNALRDAVCAQVAWFEETGDSTGGAAGGGSLSIGNVTVGAPAASKNGGATASRYAPDTLNILRVAGLLPLTAWVYG